MVKIVEAELKIDVKEDINAANITANIKPLKIIGHNFKTKNTKDTFEQPDSEPQTSLQLSGSEHATWKI